MSNPHQTRLTDLQSGRALRFSFSIIFLFSSSLHLWSQQNLQNVQVITTFDTIHVKKGTLFHFQGKTYNVKKDTIFVEKSIKASEKETKNLQRSNSFYDSVYRKLSRRKFSQLLYELAFVPPKYQTLPGNSDKVKSESPFEKYKGKIIRHINIKTLDPFGTSTIDTSAKARTGVGKALNAAHAKTRAWVIRKSLFIKEGEKIDPFLLADNERNIREMSYINSVTTYVTPLTSTSDSVDITIVTNDVWSIGGDIISAGTDNASVRLYDGNFLGLADRLGMGFSLKTYRGPFFLIDNVNYAYNNIAATFLNTSVSYTQDDIGNQSFALSLDRNFYSINTKWAFGAGYQNTKMVTQLKSPSEEINLVPTQISFFNEMTLWGGRAFRIKDASIPTHIVLTESYYQRAFSSRPGITIDSNKIYYNTTRFLTGFAFSANGYYLSDYIFQFGKLENVPYGEAFKFTMGPEINDLYTRLYGGIDLSAGNFIGGFGYLSARGVLGGYLYHKSMEDCVFKMNLNYLSPLYTTPDKKFRFRCYLISDYRLGFNFRKNNLDYTNINQDMLISEVPYDTVFNGRQSLSGALGLIMYSPLYFYGFKFAFTLQFKGGFVAPKDEPLFCQPLNAGVGLGIMIRNDNLIFPPLVITCFYYPSVPHGVPGWQFDFNQQIGFRIPDYNITTPQTETLQN
ncbi:MAG: hypothetical protein ABSD71_02700 [Bacteroidales bacterium]